jgi:hypothetical protein
MHLKNGRSTGDGAHAWKGTTSSVVVASWSKVSFWPNGSTSPGNYGWMKNLSLKLCHIFSNTLYIHISRLMHFTRISINCCISLYELVCLCMCFIDGWPTLFIVELSHHNFQLFIDSKKAYDSVRREVLYSILIEFVVPMKWGWLKYIYKMYGKVHTGKHLSIFFLSKMV